MKPLPQPSNFDEMCDIETGTTGSTRPRTRFIPRPLKVWPKIKRVHTEMTQADRLIAKFGSVPNLAKALLAIGQPKTPTTIYRWIYPKERGGTGGMVPPQAWDGIIKAAHYEGVQLTAEDFDPRVLDITTRVWIRPEKDNK